MERLLSLIFVVTLVLTISKSKAQCLEVKELKAIINTDEFDWDTLVFPKKSLVKMSQNIDKMKKGASLFIPIAINHVRLFQPACNLKTDKEEFSMLVKVYNGISYNNYDTSFDKRELTCKIMINDFKKMCRNDSLFGKMAVGVLEKGPNFGNKVNVIEGSSFVRDSLNLDVGVLRVIELYDDKKTFFSFTTKGKNNPDWIVESSCISRPNTLDSYYKSVLGYTINIGRGSFSTRLYLDTKGRFRFYICELD